MPTSPYLQNTLALTVTDVIILFSLCAIMAQILSIYGLVASVIMSNNLNEKMALHTAFLQLGAGLSVGLCGLAAGFAIGIVGDAGGLFCFVPVFISWRRPNPFKIDTPQSRVNSS